MSKAKVKIKFYMKGINELMKSQEMQSLMQSQGEKIASAAESMSNGGEFEAETKSLNWIAVTDIRAKDAKAMRAVHEDNVLLKALNSGKF